jgi:hypothetical protein
MTELLPEDDGYDLEPIRRLTRDLREAARTLTKSEARYLVDLYYTVQRQRIRSANQIRASKEAGEPNALLHWAEGNFLVTERGCKSALDAYTSSTVPGRWLKSIHGIGPVIAAGVLAHIDIERAATAGAIWRFAGLDPTVKWGKGQKRPWNAQLKVLCWKAGLSFVMQRASEKDVYGKLYEVQKQRYLERNEAGGFAAQAAEALVEKKYGEDTQARKHYEAGHYPPARMDMMARRWAVKLWLAHVHHVMFEDRFGTPPPKPYVVEHMGHVHVLGPPNWPMQ